MTISPHFCIFFEFFGLFHIESNLRQLWMYQENLEGCFFLFTYRIKKYGQVFSKYHFLLGSLGCLLSRKNAFFWNTLTLKAYYETFYYPNPMFALYIKIQYGLLFLKRCIASLRTDSNMCYGQKQKNSSIGNRLFFSRFFGF